MLAGVRRDGTASSRGTYRNEVGGLAAPIRDHTAGGRLRGGVLPLQRFGDDRFGALRDATSAAVSGPAALGGPGRWSPVGRRRGARPLSSYRHTPGRNPGSRTERVMTHRRTLGDDSDRGSIGPAIPEISGYLDAGPRPPRRSLLLHQSRYDHRPVAAQAGPLAGEYRVIARTPRARPLRWAGRSPCRTGS